MKFKFIVIKSLPILTLLAVTVIILWPGINGPLIYDDYPNLSRLIGKNVNYETAVFENTSGPLGRSFTMATFAANHWIKDGLIVFDLKLTNLLIHLLNGVLVYYLIYILLKTTLSIDKVRIYSFLITGLWILNPVNTETVLYVIQRAALLATTFMLIASIAYIRIRLSCTKLDVRTLRLMFVLVISWAIAMICKENAVLLPIIILCIEICFFDYFNLSSIRIRTIFFSLFIFLISFLLITILANNLGFLNYNNRGFSLQERLYTQPVVLIVYLQELLIPQSVDVGLYWDDFKIRKTLWNQATFFSFLFIAVLIISALLNLRRSHYKHIGAGILIFFSGHLLESTIFPLELFFRHRNYFPSIGVFLSVILLLDKIIVTNHAKKMLIAFCIIYCGLFGYQTFTQSQVWSSYNSILLNGYKNHPESLRANLELIGALAAQKDLLGSLAVGNKMISARPIEALPIKIQRFYLYCELANEIPEYEYNLLQRDLNLIHPTLISAALNKFLQSYKRRQCSFINIRRIVNSFTSWIDRELISEGQSTSHLWSIEYYMIEFLFLLGAQDEALERLETYIKQGNLKALYFKEFLLESDQSFEN